MTADRYNMNESSLSDTLSLVFRTCLIGRQGRQEDDASLRSHLKKKCADISDLLDERKDTLPSASDSNGHIGDFLFDVWTHIIYQRCCAGLDLGSLLESVMYSRVIAKALRESFRYIHSFSVLHDTETGEIVLPLREHQANAPLFPSGEWVFAEPAKDRLGLPAVIPALRDFALRIGIRDARVQQHLVYDSYRSVLSATTMVRGDASAVSDTTSLFTSATLSLLRPWGQDIRDKRIFARLENRVKELFRNSGYSETVSDWAGSMPQIRIPDADEEGINCLTLVERVQRDVTRLFILGVFERAAFGEAFGGKMVSPVVKRALTPGTDLEQRYNLTYYHAGRLLYHALFSGAQESEPRPETEAFQTRLSDLGLSPRGNRNRARLLVYWLMRRIVGLDLDKEALEKARDLPDGLARLASACVGLQYSASRATTAEALQRFSQWDTEISGLDPDASPWRRHAECSALFSAYEALLDRDDELPGFTIAVHNTGPIGAVGTHHADVEAFRIDVLREEEPRWKVGDIESDIQQTLRLDAPFSHVELLAVDQERQRRLQRQKDEFEQEMRGFTGNFAHELSYIIDDLGRIVAVPQEMIRRIIGVCYWPGFLDATVAQVDDFKEPNSDELSLMLTEFADILDRIPRENREPFANVVKSLQTSVRRSGKPKVGQLEAVSKPFADVFNNIDAVIRTVVDTARNSPETVDAPDPGSNKRMPRECNLRDLLEGFLRGEKGRPYESLIRPSWDDVSTNRSCYLPAMSIRYLILPELIRNAGRRAARYITLNASILSGKQTRYPEIEFVVTNDMTREASGFGAGLLQIAYVLSANLGLTSNEVDRYFRRGPTEWDSHVYEARIRIPTSLYCRTVERHGG